MRTKLIVLLLIVVGLSGCQNEYQKLLKGSDYEMQYKVAMMQFEEEDYYRAQQLFEGLIAVYRGSEKGENALFYLARCHYEMEDYMLAGYYFKTFATTYPNGERLEESQYYAALSYFNESPKTSLDQTYTEKAINEFQIYINKFPESERVDSCNIYIDKLRFKLEKKAFDIAGLYMKLEDYKAASMELNNFLLEYPDTDYREKAMFLLVKSSYELAKNSITSKQLERYEDAIDNYYIYIDAFPNGEDAKDAERMFTLSKKYIDKY